MAGETVRGGRKHRPTSHLVFLRTSWRKDAASAVSEQKECFQVDRVARFLGDLYMPALSGCRIRFTGLASVSPVSW